MPEPHLMILIKDSEFLRDVRFALHPFVSAKMGRLDEGIAAGFGYGSRAALLPALNNGNLLVEVKDDAFRSRMSKFGIQVPEGTFLNCVMEKLAGSERAILHEPDSHRQETARMATMILHRLPTEEDLDLCSMETQDFNAAFNVKSIPDRSFAAEVMVTSEEVFDLDGWLMPLKSPTSWYSII